MFARHPFFTHRPDEGGHSTDVQPEGQGAGAEAPQEVQPDEGQGHASASLYDEALSSVPEEHRQYVESHFKEWDRKVTEKLQSAAEDRKAWEPYEQLGIRDRFTPDQMSALVEIADALSDPESAKELVRQLAEELEVDLGDPIEDDDEDDPSDPVSSLRREVEELRAFKESLTQRDQEAEALAALQQEYAEVKGLHGRDFSEKEEQRLAALAERFARSGSETPLKDAYAFISEISGDAEAAVVKAKAKEPKPAEPAGRASSTPDPVTDFDTAQRLLRARMTTSV